VGTDTFSGALARDAGTNVGLYNITQGTLTLSTNYTLAFTAGVKFEIKTLTVTVTPTAGQYKIYGAGDPPRTYGFTPALVGTDTFSGALARDAGTNVGLYNITQGTLALSANYTLAFTTGVKFEIKTLTVTVTPTAGQYKIYGAGDPTLAYTFAPALITGDTFSGALARDAGANVGLYNITQGTLALSTNYTLAFTTGVKFEIKRKSLTITADNKSKQYSDPLPTFTVAYSGFVLGEGPSNLGGTLTCTTTATATSGPGTYPITCSGLTSANYAINNVPGIVTVTQEDARVTYAGNLFVGIPLSSTTSLITLIATIQDITATGDAGDDSYPGDIRNATLTFVDRGNSNATLCTNPVLLVNSSDTKTGSVTCTFTGTVGSTGSTQYTVGISVSGYYTRNASTDNTVVTISQVGAGMITGGGVLVMQNSAGTIAGDLGTKDNFGFNVKYNKNGNLQGNINTIVRRKESDGIQHVYQIKGNSMTALAVSQLVNGTWVSGCTGATSTSPCKAQFNSKASIQDITNPVVPLSVPGSGGSALQFNMTDYGSPGSSDTVGITLWNGSGGIWFSTNWVGSPPATVEQVLSGGNLEVH